MDFSRKVRELLRDQRYHQVFKETKLDKDSQSAQRWNTTSRGGYVAAGVGGPITGRGAHVLIIDDPIKNRDDAESETNRSSIWNWYTSTAYTRLAPGGGVLIILTRWHDDDLAGRLLTKMKENEGDEWDVIQYPALATEDEAFRNKDEALHPERYDETALLRIKRAVGPRDWSALYQQNPVADDGEYFTRDMFRWYKASERPSIDELHCYTAWDLAIGKNEANDFTVGITVGVDQQDNIWVLDVKRFKKGSLEIIEAILDMYVRWKSKITGIERGQIEMAIGPLLNQRIRERSLYSFFYEGLKPGKRDKQTRARSIQGRMQQGMVYFPSGDDTVQLMVNEFLRFPMGVHDDCVDALAWIGLMLDDIVSPRALVKKPVQGWREKRLAGLLSSHVRRSSMSA
jgi:predicted phage terminase large subunit-like protein